MVSYRTEIIGIAQHYWLVDGVSQSRTAVQVATCLPYRKHFNNWRSVSPSIDHYETGGCYHLNDGCETAWHNRSSMVTRSLDTRSQCLVATMNKYVGNLLYLNYINNSLYIHIEKSSINTWIIWKKLVFRTISQKEGRRLGVLVEPKRKKKLESKM